MPPAQNRISHFYNHMAECDDILEIVIWHGTYYARINSDVGQEAVEWKHPNSEVHKLDAFVGKMFIEGCLLSPNTYWKILPPEEWPANDKS